MTTQIEMSLPATRWCDAAEAKIMREFPPGAHFTADHVHGILRDPPHHNAFGKLFNQMAKRGLIERVDFAPSQRPERNGGLIRVWRVR